MKKWSWILTGLVIILIIIAISFTLGKGNHVSIEEIESRDNVEETAKWENYTVFIERINNYDSQLKIHNMEEDTEKEIEGLNGRLHTIKYSPNGKHFIVNEGDGVVKTTYIISTDELDEEEDIDDINDIDRVSTVGEVIWSPDSSKLLIGVQNNKKRLIKDINDMPETELEGTIDLAVYYVNGMIAETILEADETIDYWPESWDQDNVIGYLESENINKKTIEYEVSSEEKIMDILNREDELIEISEVVSLLLDVDFDRLETMYGEESVLNLLEWLEKVEIEGEEEIFILLSLSDEFIGEENYKYIETLGNTYLKDKITFIKVLASFPGKMDEIAYSFHDIGLYSENDHDITEDLKMIAGSDELDNNQKDVGIEFLNIYNAFGS